MSNSYNTHDTKLFPCTMVLTGYGEKFGYYPSPFYHNKQKYAKYEIMTERFYQFFNKNEIPML